MALEAWRGTGGKRPISQKRGTIQKILKRLLLIEGVFPKKLGHASLVLTVGFSSFSALARYLINATPYAFFIGRRRCHCETKQLPSLTQLLFPIPDKI